MGGVDHEDGEFILDCGIVGFLDIRSVHVEGLLCAEEGGVVADCSLEMGIVEVGWSWRWLWIGDVEQIDVGNGTAVWRNSTVVAAIGVLW